MTTEYKIPILAAGLNPSQLLMTDLDKKIISLDYDNTQLDIDSSGLYVKPEGINHDLLLNFLADEHVAHSGVSISPGTGMSGGGDLTTTRTLTCTITQYTDELSQDAVGSILDNGSVGDVVFTYDDATPKISGVVEVLSSFIGKIMDCGTSNIFLDEDIVFDGGYSL